MTTGTEPISEEISEEIFNAGNFRILVSTFVISKEIEDVLRENPETMQKLDDKMQYTFQSFVQELIEGENNARI